MSFSKTIQMYIFDGNPNGRIMCELSNWNGRVYKISRNELSEFSQRDDAENTGVYFLFGKNDDNTDTVYIGEAERMYSRLKQHLRDTEYWSDCIAVISKDNLLNKAHVKYLENKFYLLAQSSGRAGITNSTVPTCSSISEYDEAMLEEFISNAKLLVNTLGYKVFYPQLGVKLCSMAGGGVQKIYMVFLREPSRRDWSGSDLFHLRDGFEIKMNFDRNVSCFIFVNALMHDDFFD